MRRTLFLTFILSLFIYQNLFPQLPTPTDHYAAGVELYESGRYRAAQNELEKARAELGSEETAKILRIDFMLADCAGRLGQRNSRELLYDFLDRYPYSVYTNDVQFSMANSHYLDGNYSRAVRDYLAVDKFALPANLRDEYDFKLGYSYFMIGDDSNAFAYFTSIGSPEYEPHARYYIAYINYTKGNYTAAKKGFNSLSSNESYAPIIPFYLLQIEFLEANYDYVVTEGERLLPSAVGERRTEIARIVSESWFHKKDYAKAARFMELYRAEGGRMGRPENYIAGYSYYMLNDIGEAITHLKLAAGPDDKLTQNAAYHLAGAYLRTGDKREAMRSFSMAAEAGYDGEIREDALFNYGKLQFELGGGIFNEAINILTRYIDEYPNSPRVDDAREFLVAAYYNSRNYEAAYEAIKAMPNPDNNVRAAYQKIAYFRALEYYNEGDLDIAYRVFEEASSNKFAPKYTALTQFWKGEILYRQGKFQQAIPLYKEYVSLSPSSEREHTVALYNIGYSYFNLRQWGEAAGWFDRFLREYAARDGFRADALNRRADIHYARREFWPAAENYEAAASIGTLEKYYAEYQKALVLGLVDRTDRKIADLNGIINRGEGPYVQDAMYQLGRTYLQGERFRDAATALKRFIDNYPASEFYPAALADLGLIYQNLGENATALNYYQRLIRTAPNSPEARGAMIAIRTIYVDMNDIDGYFDFARSSGIETDTSIIAQDSLTYAAAERLYLSGNKAQAGRSFTDYLGKFPRGVYRPNAYFYLADAQLAEGRRADAVSSLWQLSEMPYNSFTVRGLEKLAPMLYEDKDYERSAQIYGKLAETSVNPQTTAAAYGRQLESLRAAGDDAALIAAAEKIMTANVSEEVRRMARFNIADTAERRGDRAGAYRSYRELASESATETGAASTFKVIEYLYDTGELDEAERLVMQFSATNTPHTYYLGKAFLVLGDIYIKRGDAFQARATLQSIVDGYSPSDDGIVDEARRRIENL